MGEWDRSSDSWKRWGAAVKCYVHTDFLFRPGPDQGDWVAEWRIPAGMHTGAPLLRSSISY